jgi:integrase
VYCLAGYSADFSIIYISLIDFRGPVRLRGFHFRPAHRIERHSTAPNQERADNVLTLPQFANDALIQHRARQAEHRLAVGPLFQDRGYIVCREDGGPFNPDHVSMAFCRFADKAGFEKVTLHVLRHTFTSLALHQGANMRTVQTMLGHSSIAITMGRYGHLLGGEQEQVAERMGAALKGVVEG